MLQDCAVSAMLWWVWSDLCSMQDGQLVTFFEVDGMPVLNDKKPRRIKNVKVQALSYCT